MEIQFKRNHPNAVIPTRACEHDAGLDLYAVERQTFENYISYNTKISVDIPQGYVGLLFARSSIRDYNLIVANAVGVIDAGYRGDISISYRYTEGKHYEIGDKICQLVILKLPEVTLEEVAEFSGTTERGVGGHGHSGK